MSQFKSIWINLIEYVVRTCTTRLDFGTICTSLMCVSLAPLHVSVTSAETAPEFWNSYDEFRCYRCVFHRQCNWWNARTITGYRYLDRWKGRKQNATLSFMTTRNADDMVIQISQEVLTSQLSSKDMSSKILETMKSTSTNNVRSMFQRSFSFARNSTNN